MAEEHLRRKRKVTQFIVSCVCAMKDEIASVTIIGEKEDAEDLDWESFMRNLSISNA